MKIYRKLFYGWAKFRHPKKSSYWIANKYWLIDKGLGWNFGINNTTTLAKHAHIKVERHIKVKGNASPYDGNWTYWSQRKGTYPGISQTVGMTLRKQKGKCAECGLHFHPDDRVEIHHLDGNYRNRRKENLAAVHGHCHDRTHQGQGNLSALISTHDKGQLGEEPDERKLSRPVLKPSRVGDHPA
jgi:RNA-directed DNA polymerase